MLYTGNRIGSSNLPLSAYAGDSLGEGLPFFVCGADRLGIPPVFALLRASDRGD